jgi:hypothetical protein
MLRLLGLAGEQVDDHGLVGDRELAQQDADLEAVAGRGMVVQAH